MLNLKHMTQQTHGYIVHVKENSMIRACTKQTKKTLTAHSEHHTGHDFDQTVVHMVYLSMLHSAEQRRRKHSRASVPLCRGRDGQPHATTSKNKLPQFVSRTNSHVHKHQTQAQQTNVPPHRQTDRYSTHTSDKYADKHILTWTDTHTLCPVNSLDVFKAA